MRSRRLELLRFCRRGGTGGVGLRTKIQKRSPCLQRLRKARVANSRSRSKVLLDVTMSTNSKNDVDTSAAPSASPPASLPSRRKRAAASRDEVDDVASCSHVLASTTPCPSDKPKRQVVLLPSVFEGRPPVVLFSYTEACGATQRPMDRAIYCDIDGPRIFYSHTDSVHEYNALINTMRQGGLYRIKADTKQWLLLWSNHPPPEVLQSMNPFQRTNHFPGSWHLGRKDLLWQSISKMQRQHGSSFAITPQGFNLPKASETWNMSRLRQPDALWIWKPCRQSCGRGIKVFSSEMTDAEAREIASKRGVIQRYIPNPLLIDGFKFDLRIYVVVLSYDPLKVYINDEGLVRLATSKYSNDPSTLDTRTMHLTNYSVNKLSPAFVQNKDGREAKAENDVASGDCQASKWSLAELRVHFGKKGLDYDATFERIHDVVIKTLIAVNPAVRDEWCKGLDKTEAGWLARGRAGAHSSSTSSCFEIYGFDVLIDDELKPWLLEVNICPSLSSGSPLDKRIKTRLVADALTLAGVRPPPSMWPSSPRRKKKHCSKSGTMEHSDMNNGTGCSIPPYEELVQRAASIASCKRPIDAVAQFDALAWETVIESHDEDMRCGGLQRIYPTASSAKYIPFLDGESYFNVVLRKWYETGDVNMFRTGSTTSPASRVVPAWVPRKVCFQKT
eukprot:TRINITY_DN8097_c0_g2_i1.p1 TRINITY_DN8097_c0_g2~~TRINITY_DN8097_c0_g2_i1.p1  ORF type:complete len:673 (+),score=77.30 TRINITY_DN8097_c0_g2_i1:180-2198(+)